MTERTQEEIIANRVRNYLDNPKYKLTKRGREILELIYNFPEMIGRYSLMFDHLVYDIKDEFGTNSEECGDARNISFALDYYASRYSPKIRKTKKR